jgi:hypothetical protein
MSEQWRDIDGFDGVYQISDTGRVKRTVDGCGGAYAGDIIKGTVDRLGYVRHGLRLPDGRQKVISPHSAVLKAFIGPRPYKFDASHKNGVKTDNRLENLCWESSSDNHRRKLEHGTLVHGEQHKCSKLKVENVVDIRSRIIAGEKKAALAREYQVSATLIGYIEKRRAWPHLA